MGETAPTVLLSGIFTIVLLVKVAGMFVKPNDDAEEDNWDDWPAQILLLETEAVTGMAFCVTVIAGEIPLHELLLTETVKFPEELTVIDCVVAPLDHRYELPGVVERITLPPGQNDVGPFAVIGGTVPLCSVSVYGIAITLLFSFDSVK